MVTLAYPGNWQELAPDGLAAAAQFRALQERWYRRRGEQMRGAWIREFQTQRGRRRGLSVTMPVRMHQRKNVRAVESRTITVLLAAGALHHVNR